MNRISTTFYVYFHSSVNDVQKQLSEKVFQVIHKTIAIMFLYHKQNNILNYFVPFSFPSKKKKFIWAQNPFLIRDSCKGRGLFSVAKQPQIYLDTSRLSVSTFLARSSCIFFTLAKVAGSITQHYAAVFTDWWVNLTCIVFKEVPIAVRICDAKTFF